MIIRAVGPGWAIGKPGLREEAIAMSGSPFLDSIRDYMLVRRYSRRTVKSYLYWIRNFIVFHGKMHPEQLKSEAVEQFLTFLAIKRHVSATTQSITLNALVFLYAQFLERPLGDIGPFRRASRQQKLPVVLTREEIARLLSNLESTPRLMASILYGWIVFHVSSKRKLDLASL